MISTMFLLLLGLSGSGVASEEVSVQALAGARTAPGSTAVGPSELQESEPPAGLGVLRFNGELPFRDGFWVGGTAEVWSYVPSSDLTLLRLEPRVGWAPVLDGTMYLETGGRYLLEVYPWERSLGSGRAEASVAVGASPGAWRVGLIGSGAHRAYFWMPQWSFQAGEVGVAAKRQGDTIRLGLQFTAQGNVGVTVGPTGGTSRATGTQQRLKTEVGWTGRRADVGLAWRLSIAHEGEVEDATRPQFTPMGQYAEDADALSAGGFVQNRFDVGGTLELTERVRLQGSALARIRSNESGQASATWTRTLHVETGAEVVITKSLSAIATAGATSATLADGGGLLDIYGWAGLCWRTAGE